MIKQGGASSSAMSSATGLAGSGVSAGSLHHEHLLPLVQFVVGPPQPLAERVVAVLSLESVVQHRPRDDGCPLCHPRPGRQC